jgi:CO/xanthine dehydrogenase Mo-binding subunit
LGAKVVGEPRLVPTAPAVAKAAYDAIGPSIKNLPATFEEFPSTLKKNKEQQ